MIAALAEGTSRIRNFSNSADCAATISCLRDLGVDVKRRGDNVLIQGAGSNRLRAPSEPLDCGNSGTTMRLLAGILAGQAFKSVLTGDESLRARPMQRIIEPLSMMGADLSSNHGRAPLVVQGRRPLRAITYELPISSAQVKSCVLLAGLSAEGQTRVIENEVTRDHTERMLRWFGVPLELQELRDGEARSAAVTGFASLSGQDVSIPGDISSASYFIAAAALLSGSSLEVAEVGLNPTRTAFLSELNRAGMEISASEARLDGNESVGFVRVHGTGRIRAPNAPMMIRGSLVPQLIDELPLLAVVGSQVEGGIEIRDAAELRVKESDRIASTAQNLRAMGAEVEEFDDGLRVTGPTRLRGATIDPRGDHRLAMAFAVAGLLAEGETEIEDSDCVGVSFPEFFEMLESVVER